MKKLRYLFLLLVIACSLLLLSSSLPAHAEQPETATSGSGATGNVTEGEKEGGAEKAKSAAISLAQLYAEYQACLNEHKMEGECKLELGKSLSLLAVVMGTEFIVEGLACTYLSPAVLAVVGPIWAAKGIYETGKDSYNAVQRLINAPAVAAESGTKQMQKELLSRFGELVKGVQNDVDSVQALRSQSIGLCDQVNMQVQSAKEVDQNSRALLGQLTGLIPLVEKQSGRCSEASDIMAELDSLQSGTEENEGKVTDGLDGARRMADNCSSRGDAEKIRAAYDNCKGLAVRMIADASIAKGRNERLSAIKAEADGAMAASGTAEEIRDKIGAANTRIHEIASLCISNREKVTGLNDRFAGQRAGIEKHIDDLRYLLPDEPPSEVYRVELENALDSVRVLKNTLADIPETNECAFGDIDPGEVTTMSLGLESVYSEANNAFASIRDASAACADITTEDAEVENMGVSANWALSAVGMNEDLPQKADACLAKLNTQKDSLMAAAKCPPNSAPVWNEQAQVAQCQCSNGYRWDDASAACLIDKDAQVAAADCSSYPNTVPYWDEKLNKPWCCPKGLTWDQSVGGCVGDRQSMLALTDCSKYPNSVPTWDEKQNKPMCGCPNGLAWNQDSSACVVDKQAQVAAADCSGTPNSRPYWDENANGVRCSYCNNGYHWKDNTGLDCVADNNGGENGPSWDGLNNAVAGAVNQIIKANTQYQEDMNRINNNYNNGLRELNNQPQPVTNQVDNGAGIKVDLATYGANCKVQQGNATKLLATACNGRNMCNYTIGVHTDTDGDPAFGCVKNFVARWHCGNGAVKEAKVGGDKEAGWGMAITLSCP